METVSVPDSAVEATVDDLVPPARRTTSFEKLFTTKAHRRVQTPGECHEYKKVAGSSDGAKTYDTTAT